MLNLIRRDAILQKWQLYVFLPFIIFFIIMDSHPALTFLMASLFIPFNAFAYDAKAATNILLNSLPYTRSEIIASRYLGAVIYMVVSISIASLALFVSSISYTWTDIAIASALFLIFAAITFPLFYIFNPGVIFYVVLFSFILLAGIGPPIARYLLEQLPAVTEFLSRISTPVIYVGSGLAVLIIYIVSWTFTTFVYQRKAF